jgi:methylase of polypeptide subunit release factors
MASTSPDNTNETNMPIAYYITGLVLGSVTTLIVQHLLRGKRRRATLRIVDEITYCGIIEDNKTVVRIPRNDWSRLVSAIRKEEEASHDGH